MLGGQGAHRSFARALERQERRLFVRRLLQVAAHRVQLGSGAFDLGGADEHALRLLAKQLPLLQRRACSRAVLLETLQPRLGFLHLLVQRFELGDALADRANLLVQRSTGVLRGW